MSQLCHVKSSPWSRRGFLFVVGAAAAAPVLAQVEVGRESALRDLVPAEEIEQQSAQEYSQLLQEAASKGALAPESNPQLQRLRSIATRLIAFAPQWNPRARDWKWQINLIGSKQVNAFCMPGGKIAVFTGLIDRLQITDDELAMVLGHEMTHALREHARQRIGKSESTGAVLSLGAQLFGLGQIGNYAANIGTQLLTLKFSRDEETEADLIGLELGARAGFNPHAAITLWQKMAKVSENSGGVAFLSDHPSDPARLRRIEENIPRVQGLYQQAIARR